MDSGTLHGAELPDAALRQRITASERIVVPAGAGAQVIVCARRPRHCAR
ncbi:hypothetical protein [Streptomyces sp. FBKL.4005]|nr:hypothetical protein [Streptomyces sp. FBKL.4005]